MPATVRSHVVETEQALLAILWHGWPQAEQLTELPKDFFSGTGHNWLYKEFVGSRKAGRPLSRDVLHVTMGLLGKPLEPIDPDVLDDIIEADTNPDAIAEYLKVIIDYNCERIAAALPALAVGRGQDEIEKLVKEMQRDIARMRNVGVPTQRSFTVSSKTKSFFVPRPPAIPTGIATIDHMFGRGLRRREMSIFMAPAGTGKSALVATIAHNTTTGRTCTVGGGTEDTRYHVDKEGKFLGSVGRVLYVSKEMDSRSIMFRIYSSLSDCPINDFENMHEKVCDALDLDFESDEVYMVLTKREAKEVATRVMQELYGQSFANGGYKDPKVMKTRYFEFLRAADQLRNEDQPLHFLSMENHSAITVEMIRDEVKAINYSAKDRNDRVALVIVDYIQILNISQEKGEQRANALERASMQLKDLALSEDCHVVVISSMNRDSEASGMDRIRDSGGIQFNADNVITMEPFRNLAPLTGFPRKGEAGYENEMPVWCDYSDPNNPTPLTILRLKTEKMRNGIPGRTHYLLFQGNIQRVQAVKFTHGEQYLKPAITENNRDQVRAVGGRNANAS